MKIRITGILLLCTVIALSLPLSSCNQNSTASDLESVSDRSPPQTQFVDVPQWATEAVAFVADREIMVGIGNNRFDPQSTITKKEVAATLYRMAGSPDEIPEKHVFHNRILLYRFTRHICLVLQRIVVVSQSECSRFCYVYSSARFGTFLW